MIVKSAFAQLLRPGLVEDFREAYRPLDLWFTTKDERSKLSIREYVHLRRKGHPPIMGRPRKYRKGVFGDA